MSVDHDAELLGRAFDNERFACPWWEYSGGENTCQATGDPCHMSNCAPIFWHKVLSDRL